MSDTPRTDAETGYFELNKCEVNYRNEPYVKTEFARVLERELAAEREKAERYRLVTLKQDAELSALREDKERLDAIRHGWRILCEEGSAGNLRSDRWFIWTRDWSQPIGEGNSLRAAIDAARKEDQP